MGEQESDKKAAPPQDKGDTGEKGDVGLENLSPKELAAKLKEVNDAKAKADAQLSEKEKMIQRLGNEVGDLRKFREQAEPILETIQKGKKEGDTSEDILANVRKDMEGRYEKEDVDVIMNAVEKVVDHRNKQNEGSLMKVMAGIVRGQLDGMVRSDDDIDKTLYAQFQQDIQAEYGRFKPAPTVDAMYENLKDAYLKVIRRKATELKSSGKKSFEEDRDEKTKGADSGVADGKGKREGDDKRTDSEKVADSIVNAGRSTPTGIFG